MGAKMYGRKPTADNDNVKQKAANTGEIPIPADERRVAPMVEKSVGMGWFCLVTVPQGEYRCQDGLSEAGFASYVPTETYWEHRRKGKDRFLTELQRPIFRGYVFARMPSPTWRKDTLGAYPVLSDEWNITKKSGGAPASPIGVLGCLGNHGCPVPMPLRFTNADGTLGGLSPLAEEEREGWFDQRKRQSLIAYRNKCREEAERLAAMPVVMKGEVIKISTGAFAGISGVAQNDNNEQGRFKLLATFLSGQTMVELSVRDVENLDRPMLNGNLALRRA